MRRAGIVLATVLALIGTGAVVRLAEVRGRDRLQLLAADLQEGQRDLLHQQTGGPIAGCVSLRPKDLVAVLRWLRPGTRIAMGPAGWLNRH